RLTLVRTIRRVVAPLAVVAMLGSACGGSGPSARPPSVAPARSSAAPSSGPESPDPLAELVAAAEQEGSLTTIALSHDWCGYGDAIKSFGSRYAITINELNPDATFTDQLAAIRDSKANPGPDAPDVIDVGMAFGAKAKAEKLLAPFKVS